MSHHNQDHGQGLSEEVQRATGVNAAKCYQCGKCSAGCPMAPETSLRPHDVMRLVQRNARAKLLSDPSIWLCVSCETCATRCPNSCEPAKVIDALRAIAFIEVPDAAPRMIRSFHKAFLEQVRAKGRIHELSMAISFKLRSGALLADATAGPAMFRRQKLPLTPVRTRAIDEIRRIFDACEKAER